MQINPDAKRVAFWNKMKAKFQSYQFMQINPDNMNLTVQQKTYRCFNRINSCRSIPTKYVFIQIERSLIVSIVSIHADQSRHIQHACLSRQYYCVSIVSIHADQSRRGGTATAVNLGIIVSIVSIHADQSRQRYYRVPRTL